MRIVRTPCSARNNFRDGGECGTFAIFRRPVLAHAVHGDVGAEARQPLGECAAKPAARAGDEGDLARRARGRALP